jgi:hypothetical protein
VNPSIRPIVAKDSGRAPQGQPSAPKQFTGGVAGTGEPGDDGVAAPSGDAESDDPMFFNDHKIQVPAQGNGVDNAKMTVRIEWTTPVTDWDVRLYRDADRNGVPEGNPVSVSQEGTTTFEQVAVAETGGTALSGGYIVRVNNFSAGPEGDYQGNVTFQGPDPLVQGQIESWTLTCERPEGNVLQRTELVIGRGELKNVDLTACRAAISRDCVTGRAGARGRSLGGAKLGRTRAKQRRAFKGKKLRSRRGIDSYCVASGGTLRIAYPRAKFRRSLGRSLGRRVRNRAVLILSSSPGHRVRRIRPGARVRTLRKRLRGERRVKVGKNTWYVARAKGVRVVFKTRGGTVREVGIADSRLTRGRAASRRFLRGWKGV